MADNKSSMRGLEVLMRSLGQVTDEPDMWNEVLHRMGTAIVSDAKLRAPVDRGALRRAIDYRLKRIGLGIDVGVFGGETRGVPYAGIMELGGVIKPHKAKWLTIPLDSKYENRSPRAYDLIFKTIGGKAYMVDRATGMAAYRLKKTVTIKAQPYLRPAIEEFKDKKFQRLLSKVMEKYVGGL